jgi:hypothetical protein
LGKKERNRVGWKKMAGSNERKAKKGKDGRIDGRKEEEEEWTKERE